MNLKIKRFKHQDYIQKRKRVFESSYMECPTTGCFIWEKSALKSGYGQFCIPGYSILAHRAAWFFRNGPVDSKTQVLHRCDNRFCVNPDHLFLGTHDDNMLDMKNKNRQAKGEKVNLAKMSEFDVVLARMYADVGLTHARIASVIGVTEGCITHAVNKITWRWV